MKAYKGMIKGCQSDRKDGREIWRLKGHGRMKVIQVG